VCHTTRPSTCTCWQRWKAGVRRPAQFLGDPDFSHGPITKLLSSEYIQRRALEVNPTQRSAMSAVRPGTTEHHNTTHFSASTKLGNAVSNTYTLNDDFGSGWSSRVRGSCSTTRWMTFPPSGRPNLYGVVGGEANAIAPGKRPLSSMTRPFSRRRPCGTGHRDSGRVANIHLVFQVIVNWHDFQMPLAQAVDARGFTTNSCRWTPCMRTLSDVGAGDTRGSHCAWVCGRRTRVGMATFRQWKSTAIMPSRPPTREDGVRARHQM